MPILRRFSHIVHYCPQEPPKDRVPDITMPAIEATASQGGSAAEGELRFPPVTREHILHCSYDYWFPKCAP